MKALVLGCGPAGLLAAHAAKLHGYGVEIFSVKQKSRIGGAQYLHKPIPGLTPDEPEGLLTVDSVGTRAGYASKVYGDPDREVSWDLYVDGDSDPIPIWDIIGMYDRLYDEWEGKVLDTPIDAGLILQGFILGGWSSFDVIISTIPANFICKSDSHSFIKQPIMVVPIWYNGPDIPDNTIVYNGDEEVPWYRSSFIFNRGMTEYSSRSDFLPETKEARWVEKPLTTDCDCWKGSIMKVGRYGKWAKGDLVTDAFTEVYDALR